jgi:imidazolonepropionase-like amidohydrolase
MGTRNAGEYVRSQLQKEDKFGQVAVGYRANLLLLSSNPLEDMSVLRTPEGVMLGGSWYDPMALKNMIRWE